MKHPPGWIKVDLESGRDVLLGRAEDWKGKGARPGFQPEWMRVLPLDKELRAYLRYVKAFTMQHPWWSSWPPWCVGA